MKHQYPDVDRSSFCPVIYSLLSLSLNICFENSFLSALTWNKFLLMKSDNCDGRFNIVCETNPLKNNKYQKLERGPYQI